MLSESEVVACSLRGLVCEALQWRGVRLEDVDLSEARVGSVLLERVEGSVHVLLRRGPEGTRDCGASLRAALKACAGRGGGRPEVAQGKLPPGADLDALLRAQAG